MSQEEGLKKFMKSIAETRYDFDNDMNRRFEEHEIDRYNAFLFNLAKRLNLPIQEMYDEVEAEYEAIEKGEWD